MSDLDPRRDRAAPPADTRLLLHIARLWRRGANMGENRPPCPHCGATWVVRWGSFRGRQRHRCRSCGRTFSDFTGTPFERTRKPGLWVTFADGMARGDSVRRSARVCGIAPSTAFRWRHALLRSDLDGDAIHKEAHALLVDALASDPAGTRHRAPLTGTVACSQLRIPESFKGRSPPSRESRSRAVPWGSRFLAGRRSWVLVLAGARSVHSRTLRGRLVHIGPMHQTPGPAVLGGVRERHLHGRAKLASSRALRWTRLTKEPLFRQREAAQGFGAGRMAALAAAQVRARLRDWLVRFRGPSCFGGAYHQPRTELSPLPLRQSVDRTPRPRSAKTSVSCFTSRSPMTPMYGTFRISASRIR
jgi:transposase-like protein